VPDCGPLPERAVTGGRHFRRRDEMHGKRATRWSAIAMALGLVVYMALRHLS